jgi:hypothetical protein
MTIINIALLLNALAQLVASQARFVCIIRRRQ